MRNKMAMVALSVAGTAFAGQTTITLEELSSFDTLTDQFTHLGVMFSGEISDMADFNPYSGINSERTQFSRGFLNVDQGRTAVLSGSDEPSHFAIMASNGGVLSNVSLDFYRNSGEDLRVLIQFADANEPVEMVVGSSDRISVGFQAETLDLSSLFNNRAIRTIVFDTTAGPFTIDNFSFLGSASVPMPSPALLGSAGLLGLLVSHRRR